MRRSAVTPDGSGVGLPEPPMSAGAGFAATEAKKGRA